MYRLRAQEGGWTVDALPWVVLTAAGRQAALEATRAAVAEWLDVPPEAFDVEA